MSDFQPGEIVDITIRDARVVNTYPTKRGGPNGAYEDTGTVLVVCLDRARTDDRNVAVNLATPGITAEHSVPNVRPGDLWRDRDGTLWFGVEGDDGNTYLMCSPSYSLPVIDAVREWGPLIPVHREGGDQR